MKFSHVTFIVGFTNDKKEIYALKEIEIENMKEGFPWKV